METEKKQQEKEPPPSQPVFAVPTLRLREMDAKMPAPSLPGLQRSKCYSGGITVKPSNISHYRKNNRQ